MRAGILTTICAATALGGCIPSVEGPRYDTPPPPQRDGYSYPQDYERRSPADAGVTALPAPPPAWTARPVTPDARTIPAGEYVVQPGDSLRAVAERTGAGSEAIARANGLTAPFVIRSGQRLTIPGGRYHLVRSGETGIAIARAYGVDWGRIVTANALTDPFILRVGQRVVIPGDATRPPTAAERAAAFRLDIDDIITGSQPTIAENQRPVRPSPTPARPIPSVAQIATPRGAPGRFLWPVASGPIVRRFGPGGSGERNNGIKIAVPIGTPILAATDGVVAYAGSEVAAFGGLVMLSHGGGLTTVYGHASQLLVTRGQAVKRGQTIALSGNSGFADRPEVHFEIRQGRTPVDPLPRLPAR
ncbi:peptidoglycan DD-metalloendopeptidase family protein [Sphingomonas donggukensis]|uniref:Peptidoglycan DD-metalloendopeptidase family protein n=1 Tax=Sphingomonas donggukensis TaxID=2949093 RepID=A0ABY4TVE7_9SPHN|nr:peptidoglycan DD-metalloendopeptidase family protein [Sphingomonas donggukensis]URW76380.1 peptidoglycan DD-metalloendopeptidase family protein [Sphingomonas donggukensis]